MDYLHREKTYLKENNYTFVSKEVKGRFQGVVVSHIDEYAIPNLVYGVLYIQDELILGVDWYPGEELEIVTSHRNDWLNNLSDKSTPVKIDRYGEVVLNYGGKNEISSEKYGPT